MRLHDANTEAPAARRTLTTLPGCAAALIAVAMAMPGFAHSAYAQSTPAPRGIVDLERTIPAVTPPPAMAPALATTTPPVAEADPSPPSSPATATADAAPPSAPVADAAAPGIKPVSVAPAASTAPSGNPETAPVAAEAPASDPAPGTTVTAETPPAAEPAPKPRSARRDELKLDPLQKMHPDRNIVVCEAGCAGTKVVFDGPRAKAAGEASKADIAAASAGAVRNVNRCEAGCYPNPTGFTNAGGAPAPSAQPAPPRLLDESAGRWMTTVVPGAARVSPGPAADAPSPPPAAKAEPAAPAAKTSAAGKREDWMARINKAREAERGPVAEPPASEPAAPAQPGAPRT